MDYGKLALLMLYALLCRLTFSSSSIHLCPKDQALALLQFKQMFTTYPDNLGYLDFYCHTSYPKMISWNRSRDCCSWEGVSCDKTTGQVIELDLSCSQLQGKFHSNSSLFKLSNLKRLNLSYNDFSGSHISPKFGPIPKPLWNLTRIELLYLGNNQLEGQISQFFKFSNLQRLSLGNNNLDGRLECFNGTQLRYLEISSNSLTGPIPSNVSGLQNLNELFLSFNYLNGTIPSWIFSLPSLDWLELSNNHFSGKIEEFKSKTLSIVDLTQNQLQGPIPNSLLNQPNLKSLLLSQNNLSGQIASTICNLKTVQLLDLGSNNLQGTIPECLGEMDSTHVLDLSNNNLTGTIQANFSTGNIFKVIKLHGNKLEGKIPGSLINCKYLELLDLGNNVLNDTFPKWLGILPNLKILYLRSNKLHGSIRASRNKNFFAKLQIMDLSSNAFSGNLPAGLFEKFQSMKLIDKSMSTLWYWSANVQIASNLIFTTKGLTLEFPRVLNTSNMVIDLSRNRFEGCIPSTIGGLIGLRTLNLSHNGLECHIPPSLQHLSVLESLDLSFNKIGGGIPQQLASLTSLAVLNLSYNHLVGCIPKGNQFDTFENSSYQGMDGLRGFPLSRGCGDDGVTQATTPVVLDQGEEEDSSMISWQAVLIGYSCGLVIALSIIYIMLSTQNPLWFCKMVEELERKIVTRIKNHKKRQ
ncbi:receptor-like protein Cf-9 homolog isoform X2 [Nicotiana tabacum]|uniref:Probable LRR receptor-like serine/threonine-protein kinase At4g08850 isoform X2 n=1 Tax=Nicotiana tabacum TaxID=4097 RepID=A0A1S4AHW8_TOBAC|nr:PREDICTED: probable LRR receptor-like serine/threonine-protein kinase At4g08850 isoform X2 [Nicotiana tabacum]